MDGEKEIWGLTKRMDNEEEQQQQRGEKLKETCSSFKKLGVCEQLVEACENLGWKGPTKIQIEAIPHALQFKDLMVPAQTDAESLLFKFLNSLKLWDQALVSNVLWSRSSRGRV